MTPDRKKPGVAFWATLVVVAGLAYVLSSGPATWLQYRKGVPGWASDTIDVVYWPLDNLESPALITRLLQWYWDFWRS